MKETTTEFGTRIILLSCTSEMGSMIVLNKHESERLFMHIMIGNHKLEVQLTQTEILTLIEALAVAARVGTGREIVDAAEDKPKVFGQPNE